MYAERDAYEYGADTGVVSSPLRPTYVYTSPIRNSVFSPLERSSFLPLRLADNRLQTTDSLLRNPLAPASLTEDYIRTNPLRLATNALTGSTPLTRAQEVLSRSSPLAALEASTPLSRLEDINVFRGRVPSEADSLFRSSLLRPLEENVLARRPFSPLEDGLLRTSPLRRGVGLLGDRLYPDSSILSSAVSPLLRAEDDIFASRPIQRLADSIVSRNDPLRTFPLRGEESLLRNSPFQSGLFRTTSPFRLDDALSRNTRLARDGIFGDALSPLSTNPRLWGEALSRSTEDISLAEAARLRLAENGPFGTRDTLGYSDALLRASDERISGAVASPAWNYADILSPSLTRNALQRAYGVPAIQSLAGIPAPQSPFQSSLLAKDAFRGLSPLTSWNYLAPVRA